MIQRIPLYHLTKAKILRTVEENEPINIKAIARKSRISRTTVYHHLIGNREFKKLFKIDKQGKKHAQPVIVTINKDTSKETIKMFKIIFPNLKWHQ